MPPDATLTAPAEPRSAAAAARETLHSANSGIVVERVGQLRAESSAAGRRHAREAAERVNAGPSGAYVSIFEETFGTEDRLHWLIHLESLDAYDDLAAAVTGEGAPPGGWERMFVDGSLHQTVLMPQSFGMYGTASQRPDTVVKVEGEAVERFLVPTAAQQTDQDSSTMLHSGNCGLLMHRVGELHYEFRAEGRQFARALAEIWNRSLAGEATIFLYEEVFGRSDQIHWLIHLKSLSTYYHLMGFRARVDPEAREIFTKQWIPAEKGGGGWERMFVQGSLRDLALTPLRPPAAGTPAG